MKTKYAVFAFFGFAIIMIGLVASFTLAKDPYCNSCTEIDMDRYSVNSYYEAAQILKGNPDAEVLLVGTSRGQRISPEYVSEKIGVKVLNLAIAGSGAEAKIALIELAKKLTKLKLVIWQADYFEILGDGGDSKLHAMKLFGAQDKMNWEYLKSKALFSIDHVNFEAAVSNSGKAMDVSALGLGYGRNLPEKCFSDAFIGEHSPESLVKEVELMYFNYTTQVFRPAESAWKKDLVRDFLKNKIGVEFMVVFVPYHPDFNKKLKLEHPEVYQRHVDWIQDLQQATGRVFDYTASVPSDDGSPKYWDDGTHFTCYTSYLIVNDLLPRMKAAVQ